MEPKGAKVKSKVEDIITEAKNFFEAYKKDFAPNLRMQGDIVNSLYINFIKLAEFSNLLADEILHNPEDTLRMIEVAIGETGIIKNVRVRLTNIPAGHELKVRNIRSRNLNELVVIEGIVRQASDVRPQVVNAKFECPSCGTTLSVLQIEKKFREPSRCSCGRTSEA